jgi:hypothetical protein
MRISLAAWGLGLVTSVALAVPAQANPLDDQFLSSLNNAGVNYGDPGGAVALGQSVCPMLAQPGGTFAAAASNISGHNGMSPAMAQMFTGIAISMYCPSMVASIANGNMPNLPQVPGMPGI